MRKHRGGCLGPSFDTFIGFLSVSSRRAFSLVVRGVLSALAFHERGACSRKGGPLHRAADLGRSFLQCRKQMELRR